MLELCPYCEQKVHFKKEICPLCKYEKGGPLPQGWARNLSLTLGMLISLFAFGLIANSLYTKKFDFWGPIVLVISISAVVWGLTKPESKP